MCSIQYYTYHMCSTPHTIGVVWKRCDDITPSLYFIKAGILSHVRVFKPGGAGQAVVLVESGLLNLSRDALFTQQCEIQLVKESK